MYKNQLQELAQRSCFNLPSYTCIREGPDHAPRFKATVNFNGETFESPQYCTTLRQAEHSAAEMALNALASRRPSNSLAARILMYKNQLQMLAQKSCFNFPSYSFVREGPDHAPRFKAVVNFNGENFESLKFYSTLRHAEHSAAEVAIKVYASRGSSNSLAAKILDETGVYKNLLQEVSQRVGASLPIYETFRSGLGHLPVFTCTVELAGIIFTGEPAKNKKQAEKNAAMAAWTSLKLMVQQSENAAQEKVKNDEQEHVTVARALQKYLIRARLVKEKFPIRFPTQNTRPTSTVQPPATSSKILPFLCPRQARNRPVMSAGNAIISKITPQSRAIANEMLVCSKTPRGQQTSGSTNENFSLATENQRVRPQKFPAAGAAPYIPIRHLSPHHRIAPPVTVRSAVPVFSPPPLPPPSQSPRMMRSPSACMAPPGCLRQGIPGYPAPSVSSGHLSLLDSIIPMDESTLSQPPLHKFEEPLSSKVLQTQLENPPSAKTRTGYSGPPVGFEQLSLLGSTMQVVDKQQFSKPPLPKMEEPLGSKVPQMENPSSAKATAGRVVGPPVSKVQAPVGSTIPPRSEVSAVRVELPVPKVAAVYPACSTKRAGGLETWEGGLGIALNSRRLQNRNICNGSNFMSF